MSISSSPTSDLLAPILGHPVAQRVQTIFTHPRAGPPLRALAGLVGLILVLRLVYAGNPAPAGVLVFGGIIGLLYALIAFGLVLVYRANRIINFAQAEIGAAAAILAVLLIKVHNVPYLVALPLALVVGMASGGLTEVLVVRRFAKAPRLVLSVATIGLALVFGAFQLILPIAFGVTTELGIDSTPIQTPLSGLELKISPLIFDGNSFIIVIATALVLGGLTAFFKLTDIGYAVRAAAENSERALLLGVPVALVSSVVWMIAGALSALGVFMRVPLTGLPIGGSVGPFVLLYALAAAVIARMERFGTALVAAVGLGITEQAVFFSTRDGLVPVAITLPVLLGAMLLQRLRTSRGQDTGLSTWSLSKDHKLTPPELRSLPEVRLGKAALGLLVLAGALVLPHVLGLGQQILVSVVVIFGIVATSLVILTGWSGQISLGQWGISGLGAAVAGGVTTKLSGDFFVALLVAGLAGAVVAVIIGLPALRVQGLYLAVTTLAFALAVQVLVLNPKYFSWLLPSVTESITRPLLFERYDISGHVPFYYVTLGFLLLCLASARALRRSRAGRLLIAVRDNPRGAQAYGVGARSVRLWAFGISGFWAALAGGLFVYHQEAIDHSAFAPSVSLTLLVIVVIGGSTTLSGAMIGTAYMGFLRYSDIPSEWQLLSSGVGALILLMFFPGGLAELFYGARDRILRFFADRRGIVVPSLVADKRVEAPDDADAAVGLSADRDLGSIVLSASNAHERMVRCPECGEHLPAGEAADHEHLAVRA